MTNLFISFLKAQRGRKVHWYSPDNHVKIVIHTLLSHYHLPIQKEMNNKHYTNRANPINNQKFRLHM